MNSTDPPLRYAIYDPVIGPRTAAASITALTEIYKQLYAPPSVQQIQAGTRWMREYLGLDPPKPRPKGNMKHNVDYHFVRLKRGQSWTGTYYTASKYSKAYVRGNMDYTDLSYVEWVTGKIDANRWGLWVVAKGPKLQLPPEYGEVCY